MDVSVNISVVVAAKNESRNIPLLTNSLNNQNYPKDSFEVIIVDDNSEDGSFELIKEKIKDIPDFRVVKALNKELPAKKGALTIGVSHAVNPFIVITDADCAPKKDWLKACSAAFQTGAGLIFGIAPFVVKSSLVNHVSCFENLRAAMLTFAAAGLNIPYSARGGNFGFSREAFDKLGGYKGTMDTVSGDDDLLIREAVKNKIKISVLTDAESFVYTNTPVNFKDYIKQKARHTSTSNYYLFRHQFLLAVWHILNIVCMFSPALIFLSINILWLFAGKLIMDVTLLKLHQKKFGYKFGFSEMPGLQLIFECFIIFNYLNAAIRSRTNWK